MSTYPAAPDHARMRDAMVVSQLRPSGVNDIAVIAAMAEVARENFVGADNAAAAYRDSPLPLGGGRAQNLPLATGRLLTAAEIEAGDRVLLIGAAGGYTAAVLARIAREVVAVEEDAALAATATAALAGTANVRVVTGELLAGAPDADAPFDVLVIDGAVPAVPDALVAQVRPGGRIVAGIADGGVTRLGAGVRTAGGFALEPFTDIDCVPLPVPQAPRAFAF